MINLQQISPLLFILTGINLSAYSQVKICGNEQSSHPIDYSLQILSDSLINSGIDSIIIYRHWINANGYNGYEKIMWKTNTSFYYIELDSNKSTQKITISESLKMEVDSVMNFFFQNRLYTISENPKNQFFTISHDGRHFIKIIWPGNEYCFTISDA